MDQKLKNKLIESLHEQFRNQTGETIVVTKDSVLPSYSYKYTEWVQDLLLAAFEINRGEKL